MPATSCENLSGLRTPEEISLFIYARLLSPGMTPPKLNFQTTACILFRRPRGKSNNLPLSCTKAFCWRILKRILRSVSCSRFRLRILWRATYVFSRQGNWLTLPVIYYSPQASQRGQSRGLSRRSFRRFGPIWLVSSFRYGFCNY